MLEWGKTSVSNPNLRTGYDEGCFVATSHKLDMLSASKPAIFVKGEDPDCITVDSSGPNKKETAGGLAIDPATLQCRTPVLSAMMEDGLSESWLVPMMITSHQVGMSAIVRGGG